MTWDSSVDARDVGEETSVVREWSHRQPPSQVVVETVSELTGRDPVTMEPLFGWIDPDALDRLAGVGSRSPGEGTASVTFRYLDCTVLVSDGFVYATYEGDADYSN